jgi:tetratricopeptide (TPR) repeat protein
VKLFIATISSGCFDLSLGQHLPIAYLGGRHSEGLAHVERALELNPNLAHGFRSRGWLYWILGHHEKAIEQFEIWRRFSPVDTGPFDAYVATAFTYCSLGRPEEGLAWAERAVRERPQWSLCHIAAIVASSLAGRPRAHVSGTIDGLRRIEPSPSVRSIMRRLPVDGPTYELLSTALRKAGLPE